MTAMAISNPFIMMVKPKGIQLTQSGALRANPNSTAKTV
jgi:hypothetical protein